MSLLFYEENIFTIIMGESPYKLSVNSVLAFRTVQSCFSARMGSTPTRVAGFIIVLCLLNISATAHKGHDHGDQSNIVVSTPSGSLKGSVLKTWTNKKFYAFRGVPFAEPPVGNLRFKGPVKLKPWEGVKSALEDGKICSQPFQESIGPYDEDCLFLNVYTKSLNASGSNGNKPVIIFFHPGAFYSMTAASYWTGPEYLMDTDIVLVTANYRLDALGFLSTGDKSAVGNCGLKDQVEALRWIQKHIKSFGGDSNQVTISGYSAGSTSGFLHMLSPMSKGLFHRVIAMSAGVTSSWVTNKNPLKSAKDLAKLLNCPVDSTQKLIDCLRKVPAKDVNTKFNELRIFGGLPMVLFGPVVEPDLGNGEERFLTDEPVKIIKSKKFHHVPVVTGITEYEFLSWSANILNNDTRREQLIKNFDQLAPTLFGYDDRKPTDAQQITNKFKQFYFKNKPITKDSVNELGEAFSDYSIIYGEYTTAKLLAKYSEKPVYFYKLSYNGRYSHLTDPATNKSLGPVHHDDLIYLFFISRIFPQFKENDPEAFMVKYETSFWKNFATNGNPTPDGSSVQWTPLSKNGDIKYLNFDKQLKMEDWSKSSFVERMKFWESLFPVE